MNMEELLARRAELIEELERVNAAIQSASAPAGAHKVRTRRNIRNTYSADVRFYADAGLTRLADNADHEAYVSGAGLAVLQAEDLLSPRGDIQLLD